MWKELRFHAAASALVASVRAEQFFFPSPPLQVLHEILETL